LIKTTAGHTFGGFTYMSWDSSGSYKYDNHSILFSVDKKIKFPIANSYGYAINCTSSYGPTFGSGHDLHISDNSNSNTSSYVSVNNAYNMPAAPGKSYPVLTDGNGTF
jgi:hypothetical protein